MATERKRARGTVRRGLRHSSASAGPFSQPMNMYSANGKPAERPVNPPVRCDQENGAFDRWDRWSTSTTMQTATMTPTWASTASPTAVVDIRTPRAVNQMAAIVEPDSERTPGHVPGEVVGEGHRHHAAGHREHPGHGDRVARRHQQCRQHAGPSAEARLYVSDEAAGRWLGPGELGHRPGQENDGDSGGQDRQRSGDPSRHRDHSEGEVEVDPRPDVGDRREGQICRAQLPGSEPLVVGALDPAAWPPSGRAAGRHRTGRGLLFTSPSPDDRGRPAVSRCRR